MNNNRARGLPRLKGYRLAYSLLTLFILFEATFIIAQAYFLARAITLLFSRTPLGEVVPDIGLFFVAFLLRYLYVHLETVASDRYASKSARRLRDQLISTYFHEDITFTQRVGTGHLVLLALEGIEDLKQYVQIIGIRMIKLAIVPVAIVVFVYFHDPISAVILVVTVPIVVIFMILLGKAAEKMADRQFATYTRLSNHFIDSLKGLKTLKFLGRSLTHKNSISRVSDAYRRATNRTLRIAFLSSFALDFFTSLSIAFVAVGLGFRLIEGEILLLSALTILLLAPEYFSPIKQVGKDYHATLDGQVALAEINRLVKRGKKEETVDVKEYDKRAEVASIHFSNVAVTLNEKEILQPITERLDKGWIGIIGASGAGKSTFLHLLSNSIVPTQGEIRFSTSEGTTVDEETVMNELAYIPQNPYIFPLSIADNIRFYEPKATEREVENMIEQIGLTDLVQQFPNGMYEKIGEGGRTISGGQAQRIALARALLADKSIILLDEPTAQLDIETEYEMTELIRTYFANRFLFIVTHRLHWLEHMDEVIVLEKGRLKRKGSSADILLERTTGPFAWIEKDGMLHE